MNWINASEKFVSHLSLIDLRKLGMKFLAHTLTFCGQMPGLSQAVKERGGYFEEVILCSSQVF